MFPTGGFDQILTFNTRAGSYASSVCRQNITITIIRIVQAFEETDLDPEAPKPLIKEYTLNHIRDLIVI